MDASDRMPGWMPQECINSSVFNCTSESPSQRSGVREGASSGHAYMTSCALVNVFYVRKES